MLRVFQFTLALITLGSFYAVFSGYSEYAGYAAERPKNPSNGNAAGSVPPKIPNVDAAALLQQLEESEKKAAEPVIDPETIPRNLDFGKKEEAAGSTPAPAIVESAPPAAPVECLDCGVGKGGWMKIDVRCGSAVLTSEDWASCWKSDPFLKRIPILSAALIQKGYIEIGTRKVQPDPGSNRIKVMVFERWAVDEKGQLYILSELG